MNKKIRRLLCALSALALLLLFAVPAFAENKVLVVDDMEKISDKSMEELNTYARQISEKYQMDVAFFLLSNDYAPSQTLTEYARERYLNVQKLGPDGFALAHDIDGKLWTVVSSGKAEQLITDEIEDQFWAAYEPEDTYYAGAMAFLWEADRFLAELNGTTSVVAEDVLRDPDTLSLVMDEAGLLSSSEAAQLREKLGALSQKWKNDIVIVTVKSIGQKKPVEFADDYFDYNGYGQGGDRNGLNRDGLLLLINMEERDWYISTCGYSITAFTDAGIEFLGKQLIADGLSDGDYAKAFNSFADWCDKFFEKAESGKPYDKGRLPKDSGDIAVLVVFALGGGFFVAGIAVSGMKSKLKTVRKKQQAADYVRPGSLQMAYSNEQFLYKNTTRTKVETSSSGGGGGSSTHSSSSGSSHGGGGGKF